MPLNTMYTRGSNTGLSSLFSKAQSAQKKLDTVQDATQKFLWQNYQLSNDDYQKYVQSRLAQYDQNNPSQTQDYITWANEAKTVQTKVNSEYRANVMLAISQTPGNTSSDDAQKLNMYNTLYQQAAADGDENGMISLETSYNNTLQTYQSKLESEAKAGVRASVNEINRQYNIANNAITEQRIHLNNNPNISPDIKAAQLANLDAQQSNAELFHLSAAVDSDGVPDEAKIGTIQNTIANLQGQLLQNAKYFNGTLTDQNGQAVDPSKMVSGDQVIVDFTPSIVTDGMGGQAPELNSNFMKVYQDGKMRLLDTQKHAFVDMTTNPDGSVSYTENSGPVNPNDYTSGVDNFGQPYMTKIDTTTYDAATPKLLNGDGTVAAKSSNGQTPGAVTSAQVPVGINADGSVAFETRNLNPWTSKKDANGNITASGSDYSAPTANATLDEAASKLTGEAAGDKNAAGPGTTVDAIGNFWKQVRPIGDMDMGVVSIFGGNVGAAATYAYNGLRGIGSNIGAANAVLGQNAARDNYNKSIMNLYNDASKTTQALNAKREAESPAVAAAAAKYGASSRLNVVNPVTQQYETPADYVPGGPIRTQTSLGAPKPTTPALQAANTALGFNPTAGFAGLNDAGYSGYDLIGTKGGVNYYRMDKGGGYDFIKANSNVGIDQVPKTGFKLNVNDAAKELGGNAGNYTNANWHM